MIDDSEFLELIKKYDYLFQIGEVVEGVIVSIEKDMVFVDINAKANAQCPSWEVNLQKGQKLDEVFTKGEKYKFVINSKEDEEGVFQISHKKIALLKTIEELIKKADKDESVFGKVISISKGGAIVNVSGIKGFIPMSQMINPKEEIGSQIELKVINIDPIQNNFIFSNKKAYSESIEEIKREILDKVELNMVVKGTVVRLTDFGAFIDIGGIDGLLPLSQISWKWIDNPSDILKTGERIDVEIIGIDKEKQRISLSLKSLQENPWQKANDFLSNKEKTIGKVTRIKSFGVFIEVYPNVEGLLNKQQVHEYFNKYKQNLTENQEIEVGIKKFDAENQKIYLEVL